MSRLDRYLLVAIGLIALAALPLALRSNRELPSGEPTLHGIPMTLGRWTTTSSNAETVLPVDSRSLETVDRVYGHGERRVWLAVARYPGINHPDTRPALQALAPERGKSSFVRAAATLAPRGADTISAMRLSVRFPDRTVTAWYWYRLGQRIIGDEYGLRFWLAVNTIVRREPPPLFLIRVATLDGTVPQDFLEHLVPHLEQLAARAERK